MQARLVEHLACPVCAGELALIIAETVSDEVETGTLRCTACGASFPIERGIPRLAPSDLSTEQRRTAAAFGSAVAALPRDDAAIRGAVPRLDRATGAARLPRSARPRRRLRDWPTRILRGEVRSPRRHRHGSKRRRRNCERRARGVSERPRRSGRSAQAAIPPSRALRPRLLDRCDPPPPHPPAGIRSLGALAPDGTLAVWVYGYENNGFVRHAVESLRRVSTKLNLFGDARSRVAPRDRLPRRCQRGLPTADRDARRRHASPPRVPPSLAGFGFRQNYTIVFDQLVAPTAVYVKRDELRSWLEDARLEDVTLTSRRANSWRGRGRAGVSAGAAVPVKAVLPCLVCGATADWEAGFRDIALYRCPESDQCFTDVALEHFGAVDTLSRTARTGSRPESRALRPRADQIDAEIHEPGVLDIGAGRGELLAYLRRRNPALELTGIDISRAEYRGRRANSRRHRHPRRWRDLKLAEPTRGLEPRTPLITSEVLYQPSYLGIWPADRLQAGKFSAGRRGHWTT